MLCRTCAGRLKIRESVGTTAHVRSCVPKPEGTFDHDKGTSGAVPRDVRISNVWQGLVTFPTMAQQLLSGRDYLRIRDAARLLGVTEKTLRNWDRLGHLRAHRHPINGYRLYRVSDLHALLDRVEDLPQSVEGEGQQLELLLYEPTPSKNNELLPPCHWTRSVALDPKHRPQKWTAPSTTVRRDWRKFPQEAHLLDIEERRYRRFQVDEIAILQGFNPESLDFSDLTERERIAALGDAVPPPLAKALLKAICDEWNWKNRTAVEICAGIGGLAEGGAVCGLEHLMLMDASPDCVKLLQRKRSWASDRVKVGDVRTHDFSAFRDRIGLLSGGPPCQPWSQGGQRLGEADERDVLGHMPELVSIVRPEVFLFENVPGLALFAEGRYLRDLVWRLREPSQNLRYGVLVALFNAADFGVPQIRNRIFILGFRDAPGSVANRCLNRVQSFQTHRDPAVSDPRLPVWRTVGDAIGHRAEPGGWRRWIGNGLD